MVGCFVFFKQKTAYEMRISDWSSDVCSSDLLDPQQHCRCRDARPCRRLPRAGDGGGGVPVGADLTMAPPEILLERAEAVAIVTLNRPDRLNAVHLPMTLALADMLAQLEGAEPVGGSAQTGRATRRAIDSRAVY